MYIYIYNKYLSKWNKEGSPGRKDGWMEHIVLPLSLHLPIYVYIYQSIYVSRWEKDGSPVGMYPGKYAWAGRLEDGDCSINILHAEREFDHGIFISVV